MATARKQNSPQLFGAHLTKSGIRFLLFSTSAERIELCLFRKSTDAAEYERYDLLSSGNGIWELEVNGLKPGQLYAYRVHGQWSPECGLYHDSTKLLLDPYAKLVEQRSDGTFLGKVARALPIVRWNRPKIPREKMVLYEAHVKGMTAGCDSISEKRRGTFSGLASPAVINHLKSLSVTTLELLPIQLHVDEMFLTKKGLTNYWGYNTLGYFAIDPRFSSRSSGAQSAEKSREEFREAVKKFHAAGIEVVLDIVLNHTAEGNAQTSALSFRGIDNLVYYRTTDENPGVYVDVTGCGNTLNTHHDLVRRFILDCLKYWHVEMGVDGFRFDLATALGRGAFHFDRGASLFSEIENEPELRSTKLMAEPWDIGPQGYQLGNFPDTWMEWNDQYRDDVRKYWRGQKGSLGKFATRLAGSSDVFQGRNRVVQSGINFVTCHDGFSLQDLVSYDQKYNANNHEENRDGHNENYSWNCGSSSADDGPTENSDIQVLRERQKRNFILTLALSAGIPLLRAGDETSGTQLGNNNAYCHDVEWNWLKWELTDREKAFLDFYKKVLAFRASNTLLQWVDYSCDEKEKRAVKQSAKNSTQYLWFTPSGEPMQAEDWNRAENLSLSVLLYPFQPQTKKTRSKIKPLWIICNSSDVAEDFLEPNLSGFEFSGSSIHDIFNHDNLEEWRVVFDTSLELAENRADISSNKVPSVHDCASKLYSAEKTKTQIIAPAHSMLVLAGA